MILATFMPDGTMRNGTFLPLRVMLLSLTLLVAYVRFDVGRVLNIVSCLAVTVGLAIHASAVWDYAVSTNCQMRDIKAAAAKVPPGQRIVQLRTRPSLRFRADPIRHAGGYVALWSRGIQLSNYEANYYYFPVKMKPAFPLRLGVLTHDLEYLEPQRDPDLFAELLADFGQFIDVLVVQTSDEMILALARRSFAEVVWHSDDLWILTRR